MLSRRAALSATAGLSFYCTMLLFGSGGFGPRKNFRAGELTRWLYRSCTV